MDESPVIRMKKACRVVTPDRSVFQAADLASSTPALKPKKLDFKGNKTFTISNLPVPFMELLFRSAFCKKFGPISNVVFDRKTRSATLSIDNEVTLQRLQNFKQFTFQNQTIAIDEQAAVMPLSDMPLSDLSDDDEAPSKHQDNTVYDDETDVERSIADLSFNIENEDVQEEVNNNTKSFNFSMSDECNYNHEAESDFCDLPLSTKVTISMLPEGFNKDFLLFTVNGALIGSGFCKRGENPAIVCSITDKTSAEVEFSSIDAATKICDLILYYEGVLLQTKQLHVDAPKKVLSTKVEITKLPEGFKEDFVLFIVNGALIGSGFCKRGDNPAIVCSITDKTSAVVEFSSIDAATKICDLILYYEGVLLQTKQLYMEALQAPVAPSELLVSKLPEGFSTECLLFAINGALIESGFCKRGENPAISCAALSTTKAVVKFSSVEACAEVQFLNSIKYGGVSVEVEGLGNGKLPSSEKSFNIQQKGFAMYGSNVGNVQEGSVCEVELKSPAGDVIFLKSLVSLRRKFAGRNHSTGYVCLVSLLKSFGVTATIEQCTKRRKHFRDKFYSQKKSGDTSEYWEALNVIFGDAPVDSLETDRFKIDEVDLGLRDAKGLATTATFIGDGIFNNQNSKALLSVVLVNKDLLRNAKNTDSFWRQVSALLKEQSYDIPWHRCESRFKSLQKLYRDEVERLNRTGSEQHVQGQQPWYWELMDQIEGDRVTSKPMVTAAFGSSCTYTRREEEEEDDPDPDPSHSLQINTHKVAQLKKPMTKKDMQSTLLASLQAQIDLKNQYYKQKLNK